MKKSSTLNLHRKIANDAMYYIYKHIDTDINIDDLALSFEISKFHFHKIFKEQMGINIYETIKSIRLQKSSNLLLTNKHSSITKIANMCGYSSQTSFIRAFKNRFNQTPKAWRNGGYKEYSNKILRDSKLLPQKISEFSKLDVKVVKTKSSLAYYIRQKGYKRNEIKNIWQKMLAWIYTNDIKNHEQIALFHDNPTITPHDKCFYIAAVVPKDTIDLSNTNMPKFLMSGGIYATFNIKGEAGDLLKFVQWAYQEWLPQSGFETTTSPSYAIFRRNHFLDDLNKFEATFYLPIQYI